MEIDLPDVVAEVRAAFEAYERALVANDVEALDAMFHDDPRTIRFGGTENLFGYAQIKAFRAARSPVGLARTISNAVITAYGPDVAIASTLFHRTTMPGKIGRQMQTWVRFPEGWRVVAAHVSVIAGEEEGAGARTAAPCGNAGLPQD
jgi:ketosteroid isomerase-like protein